MNSDLGKWMVVAGIALAVIGGVVMLAGRLGFRGLPGDVAYEGRSVRVYAPIMTCIVLSILGTAILWFIQWIGRR